MVFSLFLLSIWLSDYSCPVSGFLIIFAQHLIFHYFCPASDFSLFLPNIWFCNYSCPASGFLIILAHSALISEWPCHWLWPKPPSPSVYVTTEHTIIHFGWDIETWSKQLYIGWEKNVRHNWVNHTHTDYGLSLRLLPSVNNNRGGRDTITNPLSF